MAGEPFQVGEIDWTSYRATDVIDGLDSNERKTPLHPLPNQASPPFPKSEGLQSTLYALIMRSGFKSNSPLSVSTLNCLQSLSR